MLLSNILTVELCGVECGLFTSCERFCLSKFHNCLVFKLEWIKWSTVFSSSIQYEQRGESTFLNLKVILFRYKLFIIYTETFWGLHPISHVLVINRCFSNQAYNSEKDFQVCEVGYILFASIRISNNIALFSLFNENIWCCFIKWWSWITRLLIL